MKLIDADRVLRLVDNGNLISNSNYQKVRKLIENIPSIDLVRCKDCIHCADDYVDTGFGAMPTFTCDIFEGYGVGIKPDHYCSYGEREDGEQE